MHMDAYRTIIDNFSYQVGWREKLYDIVSLIMFYPSCKLGFGVSTRLPKCFQEQKLMILPFSIQENWDMSYGRWLPPSQNADRQIWRETEMAVRLTGLLVCIPSFCLTPFSKTPCLNVFDASNLWESYVCYCFFHGRNWVLRCFERLLAPAWVLPGEGIRGCALAYLGIAWRAGRELLADCWVSTWSLKWTIETWNRGFTKFTFSRLQVWLYLVAMDALEPMIVMDAMEERKTPVTSCYTVAASWGRGWRRGGRWCPGGRWRRRWGRVQNPQMAADGWHSGVAT